MSRWIHIEVTLHDSGHEVHETIEVPLGDNPAEDVPTAEKAFLRLMIRAVRSLIATFVS